MYGLGEGGTVSTGGALADLVASIEVFCQDYRPGPHPEDLPPQLVTLRASIDQLELLFAHAAATFASTDEYENHGATTPVEWIRHNCKMSGAAAAERVCVGQQVQRMPRMVDSLFEGRLGFGHLVHAARAARKLTSSSTGAGFDESDLLEQAEGMSVGKFSFACRHYLHMQDSQGVVDDEVAAAQLRRATIYTGPDGRVSLSADLDPEGGAIVRGVLESLSRPTGAGDDRTYEKRTADALVEALLHPMQNGAMPQRAGQRVHLNVTASFDNLKAVAGAPAADMELSLPISGAKARRWACDCNLTRILLNSDSIPIDVGREKRMVPGATRKAVHVIYPGCGYTGCERTASWTEAHHIVHWIDGGPTVVENIVPLCFRHHALVHEGGWTIEKRGTELAFVPPPSKRVLYTHAPDNFTVA